MENEGAPLVAVVDESPSAARALGDVLEGAGFRVRAFTSPAAATEQARAVRFDAMLVEHGVRELTPLAMCQLLRAKLGRHAPPLVVLTSQLHTMPLPERSSYVAVLPRPLSIDALLAAIESAIARGARSAIVADAAE